MNLGATLFMAGRVDAAVRQFEETLDLDSNFSMAHVLLGLAYVREGTPDRAVAAAQKARARGWQPSRYHRASWLHPGAGRAQAEALATLDDLRRLAGPRGPRRSWWRLSTSAWRIATVHSNGSRRRSRALLAIADVEGGRDLRSPACGFPLPEAACPPWAASLIRDAPPAT